jgi:hypothetical protein
MGMKLSAATTELSLEFPQKLKIELLYDLAILLLGTYQKDSKSAYCR